uniref:WAP domain-containing protein n=1 Tax=Anolis carolinensis TaxID=28377 RepID=A0A803U176_ANOCA
MANHVISNYTIMYVLFLAHPGVCPPKRVLRNDDPCTPNCENDQDCLPWQKCCFSGCTLECTDLQEGNNKSRARVWEPKLRGMCF